MRMSDSRRPERSLKSERSASEIEAEAQAKRQRTHGDECEVQDFFVLLDRIQAMHRIFKQKRMKGSYRDEMTMEERSGMNVIRNGAPWKPSFELEDFSSSGIVLPRNDSPSKLRDLTSPTKDNPKNLRQIQKGNIQIGNDVDKHAPEEMFDLNVGINSGETVPATLRLFP